MKTMDERIEAAMQARIDATPEYALKMQFGGAPRVVASLAPAIQSLYRAEAAASIRAAFPELFDGTAWITSFSGTPAPDDATSGVYMHPTPPASSS